MLVRLVVEIRCLKILTSFQWRERVVLELLVLAQ